MRHFLRSILFIFLFLTVTFSPCYAWQGKVVGVADGDTVVLANGEKIRLIGVDTPESVHPLKPVQYFSVQAKHKRQKKGRNHC